MHCRDGKIAHLFLALKSAKERDDLYDGIMKQSLLKLDDLQQEAVTLQWQHGVLSNYDYLLYLNRYIPLNLTKIVLEIILLYAKFIPLLLIIFFFFLITV